MGWMLEADDEDDDVEARNKIKSPFCYDADTLQNQPSLFKLFMTEKLNICALHFNAFAVYPVLYS